MRSYFSLILLLLFGIHLEGQIDLPPELSKELAATGLEIIQPLEARYKTIRLPKNPYLDCDYGIWSKQEKLEIRYAIEPDQQNKKANLVPHVKAFAMASHLASNDEESVISKLSIAPKSLVEEFNADFGEIYFFRPKSTFSDKLNCQMLVLYKEGKGMAYVFFLFDDPNNAALDYRFYAVRFHS